MRKQLSIGILLALFAVVVLAGTSIFAQDATETVQPPTTGEPSGTATAVPPPSFTDGRINSSTLLGGLAIYCVDANSSPVNTFENGAITVWGVGDQKYINLNAAQLRGSTEVPQAPSQMEAQMTQTAPSTNSSAAVMTEEASMMLDDVTPDVMGQMPVLLARATTPNGDIGFFKLGADQFALQGFDEQGSVFTYTWTGCTEGTIDRTTEPYLFPFEPAQPAATAEFSMMVTPETTPEM